MKKLERVVVVALVVIGAMITGVQLEKRYGSSYTDGYNAGYEAVESAQTEITNGK